MIYFIKQAEFVKIGCTNNIFKRLSSLQVGSPLKLDILGLISGGKNEEKALHEKYREYNSNGEWFYLTEEIMNHVNSLDRTLMWENGLEEEPFTVISKIQKARYETGHTLESLSKKLGITKQSVQELELRELKGGVTLGKMIEYANAMGMKFDYRITSRTLTK